MKTTAITPEPGALPGHQPTPNPRTDAEKELRAAAALHKVRIQVKRMISAGTEATTILHAPIQDIERYTDTDFSAGAPVLLMIFKSSVQQAIPNGSYVVKVQHRPGATSGKALFTDTKGTVVAERNLVIRTREQAAVLFPEVYSGPDPVDIPVITSTHVWHTNHWAVDCAGWQPYRVLYY
jgi:hypothetical protein